MGLDFWSTIRGVQLAETLIRELPELNRKKEQKFVTISQPEDDSKLQDLLEKGFSFKGSFVNAEGKTVVVLER